MLVKAVCTLSDMLDHTPSNDYIGILEMLTDGYCQGRMFYFLDKHIHQMMLCIWVIWWLQFFVVRLITRAGTRYS